MKQRRNLVHLSEIYEVDVLQMYGNAYTHVHPRTPTHTHTSTYRYLALNVVICDGAHRSRPRDPVISIQFVSRQQMQLTSATGKHGKHVTSAARPRRRRR